jgi:hypothetical protein
MCLLQSALTLGALGRLPLSCEAYLRDCKLTQASCETEVVFQQHQLCCNSCSLSSHAQWS